MLIFLINVNTKYCFLNVHYSLYLISIMNFTSIFQYHDISLRNRSLVGMLEKILEEKLGLIIPSEMDLPKVHLLLLFCKGLIVTFSRWNFWLDLGHLQNSGNCNYMPLSYYRYLWHHWFKMVVCQQEEHKQWHPYSKYQLNKNEFSYHPKFKVQYS